MKINRRYARLYGVSSYPELGQEMELPAALTNVKRLGSALGKWGFTVKPLGDPIKDQILHDLAADAATVGEDDAYLLYLTGHSFPGRTVRHIYYAASDFHNPERKRDFGLSLEDIVEALEDIRARAILVILDSCLSGAIHHWPPDPVGTPVGRSRLIMASSRMGTPSYVSDDDDGEPLSVYTKALIGCLARFEALGSKEVSLTALSDAQLAAMDGNSDGQHPVHFFHGSGAISFLQRSFEPSTAEFPTSEGPGGGPAPLARSASVPSTKSTKTAPRKDRHLGRPIAESYPQTAARSSNPFGIKDTTLTPVASITGYLTGWYNRGTASPTTAPLVAVPRANGGVRPVRKARAIEAPGWSVDWIRTVTDRPGQLEDYPVWGLQSVQIDGTDRLLTADTNGGVKLWDLDGASEPSTLGTHHGPVRRLSRDHRGSLPLRATADDDGVIRVWHLRDRRETRRLHGHTGSINSVMLGTYKRSTIAVSASVDGTAIIWDVARARVRHVLRDHASSVLMARLTQVGDEQVVVTSGIDGTLRLWRVADGAPISVLYGHAERVDAFEVLYDNNSTTIVSGDSDGNLIVWDLDNARPRFRRHLHDEWIYSIALRRWNDTIIAASTGDPTVQVWDVGTGRILHSLKGHLERTTTLLFAELDGHDVIASTGEDNHVRFWDLATGTEVDSVGLPQTTGLFEFTADGRLAINYGAKMALLRPTGRTLRRHQT